MALFPISHTVPQYVDTSGNPHSGAVLKAYSSGTLNTISMATDSTGDTTAATITLNADGYPAVSGTIIIPYINEKYKLALYATQAAADADTGPIWIPDGIPVSGDFLSVTRTITTTTALDSSDNFTHINASGTITITLPDIDIVGSGFVFTGYNAGSGVVTWDGNGAETLNGSATLAHAAGQSGMFISGATNWSVLNIQNTHTRNLLETQTASASATIDFTSSVITSTYKHYEIELIDVVGGTDADELHILVSQSSSFLTGVSDYGWLYTEAQGSANATATGATAAFMRVAGGNAQGNASVECLNGTVKAYNPTGAALPKYFIVDSVLADNSNLLTGNLVHNRFIKNADAIDGIRFIYISGTIASGTFKLYGIL